MARTAGWVAHASEQLEIPQTHPAKGAIHGPGAGACGDQTLKSQRAEQPSLIKGRADRVCEVQSLRDQAVYACLADFLVFQFARRLHAIGGELFDAFARKIAPPGIAEQHARAGAGALRQPRH